MASKLQSHYMKPQGDMLCNKLLASSRQKRNNLIPFPSVSSHQSEITIDILKFVLLFLCTSADVFSAVEFSAKLLQVQALMGHAV